ncbi:Chromatin assembly factor 1 subunit [Dispira simplex]|nr:Chromatin assembly factor 1 subunit [Dispira simplex]
MRAKTIQINWHDKLSIFSADFDQHCPGRFATAGGDSNVRGDGSGGNLENRDQQEGTEVWKVVSLLRGSLADIYDLAWSADGQFLISGSVDNTARIWDVKQAKCLHCIADHSHYVQGVAWDPLGQYFATQSSDRSVNTYEWVVKSANVTKTTLLTKRSRVDHGVMQKFPVGSLSDQKCSSHTQEDTEEHLNFTTTITPTGKDATPTIPNAAGYTRLYHSENLASFFRRLCFTPDGSLLLTPAGIFRTPYRSPAGSSIHPEASAANNLPQLNTVFAYNRQTLTEPPVTFLAGFRKPSIVVRCPPQKFHHRVTEIPSTTPWLDLPYRMVIAVACQDGVVLYDTQQVEPFAYLANFHYATITDLAWSSDHRFLLMTSTDGYCSLITFDPGELGQIYHESDDCPISINQTLDKTQPAGQPLHRSSSDLKPTRTVVTPPTCITFQPEVVVPVTHLRQPSNGTCQQPTKKRIQPTFVRTLNSS